MRNAWEPGADLHHSALEVRLDGERLVIEMTPVALAAGELDNTIYVFTSDNGYLIGQHRATRSGCAE